MQHDAERSVIIAIPLFCLVPLAIVRSFFISGSSLVRVVLSRMLEELHVTYGLLINDSKVKSRRGDG